MNIVATLSEYICYRGITRALSGTAPMGATRLQSVHFRCLARLRCRQQSHCQSCGGGGGGTGCASNGSCR